MLTHHKLISELDFLAETLLSGLTLTTSASVWVRDNNEGETVEKIRELIQLQLQYEFKVIHPFLMFYPVSLKSLNDLIPTSLVI